MRLIATRIMLSVAACASFLTQPAATQPAYDPLTTREAAIQKLDLVVRDANRSRDIPVLVYAPRSGHAPVVLFSHGLGGSRDMGGYLGEHWARRGYAAVFPQHPGSDVDVWQGKPRGRGMASLISAASIENFVARLQDVDAVLDQLERWQQQSIIRCAAGSTWTTSGCPATRSARSRRRR